jgi:uncharacterized protein YkwD
MRRAWFVIVSCGVVTACGPVVLEEPEGRRPVPFTAAARDAASSTPPASSSDGADAVGPEQPAPPPDAAEPPAPPDGADGADSVDGSGGPDGPASPDEPAPPVVDPDGWPADLVALEDRVLVLVNELRVAGTSCGGSAMAAVPPLVMDPALRRAARLHSEDMAEEGYFDHRSLDGRSPWDRIADAGYDAFPTGENIAAGNSTADATVAQWVNSPGHCRNMMSPDSTEIGVGAYFGGSWGAYWTQTFGAR